jgi:hypothetical protein
LCVAVQTRARLGTRLKLHTKGVPISSSSVETEAQAAYSAGAAAGETEWLERCCASILDRDPMLSAGDILDLATTLWDRPSCRLKLPEFAAGLLFAGQLSRSR